MLARMKHGIIGAGPCGTITALLLLEAGFEVHLFDVNDGSEILDDNLKSSIKLLAGSSSPYDLNQLLRLKVNSLPASFYRAKLSGGFSNVWGATWGSSLIGDTKQWIRNYELITNRVFGSLNTSPEAGYSHGCNCMDFLDRNLAKDSSDGLLNFSRTQLAINPDVCSCIAAGVTSCPHGSIWNSKSILEQCLKYKDFSFVNGVDVTKIGINSENLSLSYQEKTDFYDGITVAAGPLGSSEILLNTFSNLRSVEVKDTLMGYMPFFKFKLNTGHSGVFAFSQFRFDLSFGKKQRSAHIQLYSHSEAYLDRILEKLPMFARSGFEKIAGMVLPHFGIALIYLDSQASSSLSISKGAGSRELNIKILMPENSKWGLRRRMWHAFRQLRIFPILPLISWAKPGESYHLGAGGTGLLDDIGFVKVDKRISVAGSLALARVDTGPITHAAMAQSSRLVEQIVHQNLESS